MKGVILMMTHEEAVTLVTRLWGRNGDKIYVPSDLEHRIDFICDQIYNNDIRAQFTRKCANGDELSDFELGNISSYLQEGAQNLALMFPVHNMQYIIRHDAKYNPDVIERMIKKLIRLYGYRTIELFTGPEYPDSIPIGELISPIYRITGDLAPIREITEYINPEITLKEFRDIVKSGSVLDLFNKSDGFDSSSCLEKARREIYTVATYANYIMVPCSKKMDDFNFTILTRFEMSQYLEFGLKYNKI